MKTKIQKWGNSLAIRIPKTFAIETKLKTGATVDISIKNNSLIIKPYESKEYTLKDLIYRINKRNVHKGIETGSPVGKEIW